MLEGPAAVGKSSSIEYLAMLANQEVYRMSLNGQVDTTDLIGKWIPRSEQGHEQIMAILRNPERAKNPETRAILQGQKVQTTPEAEADAKTEGKTAPVYFGFTRKEMMKIAELEGIQIAESDWLWQDGEVPRQIVDGAWTVLDEVNTCEPQILVRLNSILEKGGELVLHENGAKIPKPKDPSKKHQLFATVNPPGGRYRGRVPLSAEWISRWNYQNIGGLSEETAIRREQRILGCEVPLEHEKIKDLYISPEPLPPERKLTEILGEEWVRDFADKYVRAFRKISEMLVGEEVGRDQEQKFDIDQRDLTRFRDYFRAFFESGRVKKTIGDAIEYVVLGKFRSADDRRKVKDIVFGLIEVDEPVVRNLEQTNRVLRNIKRDLISMNIPEHHRRVLTGENQER